MTLWTSIKSFTSGLPSQQTRKIDIEAIKRQNDVFSENGIVYQGYQLVKQLANIINSVYGLSVTLFLVESILYYATSFDDIFVEQSSSNDITKVMRLLFYFGSTCAVLFAAADVSKQVK